MYSRQHRRDIKPEARISSSTTAGLKPWRMASRRLRSLVIMTSQRPFSAEFFHDGALTSWISLALTVATNGVSDQLVSPGARSSHVPPMTEGDAPGWL